MLASALIGKRYVLHELLGQGGMGSVFRATDRLNGQFVALKKVIAAAEVLEFTTSYNLTDFRLALAQEFKLSASLRHPNIIEVLDYGFDNNTAAVIGADDDSRRPYFTMEFLENPQNILEAGKNKPVSFKITLLTQMLQALAYLHRRGILHRDLKPANVLVVSRENGQHAVKVLDFGLSVMRERSSAPHEESEGTTAGTLAYMAPEMLMGKPASESSDLYAVGIIAYELLAGRHPFDASDIGKLVNQTLYDSPDIAALDIDEQLALVIEQLLQKTPDARYQTANDVIAALNAVSENPIPIETAATRESYLQAARLVGRSEELDQISAALTQAIKGAGSMWLVGGENGVGKSRLVDELRTLAMVQGALVMRGQSISVARSPYHMWRPIFRWLCLLTELDDVEAGLLKMIMPDVETLLGRTVPDVDRSQAEPENVQARILQKLSQALRQQGQPIVIIFEDLHWAGSESLNALAALSKHVQDLPLLIMATYRDDERPDIPSLLPQMPLLKLNRLNQDSIAELSAAILGEAGKQPQVVNLLQRETEGNVFFLIEIVRALAEEAGRLDQIGLRTLPEHVFAGGVRRIIQRRLGRIAPEDQPLLRLAAVIGRQLDLKLLKLIEPEADLDQWLTDCANTAVFDVQDEQWRFAHDRLRDGVLENLSVEERQALHRKIAQTIENHYGETTENTAVLAYHWGGANDAEKEEYYTSSAGRQAVRSGAYHEASTFYRRALMLVKDSLKKHPENSALRQKEVQLKMGLAEAHLGLGEYDQAKQLYRESLLICDELEDAKGMAEASGRLGDVDYVIGQYEQARELYQESFQISEKIKDQSGIARALNRLGNVAYELGDLAQANQYYQQSLNLSREIGDQWGMAGALRRFAGPITDHSAYAFEKKTYLEELTLFETMGNKRGTADTWFKLGIAAAAAGEMDEALQFHQKSLLLRQELNDLEGAARSHERLGVLDFSQNRYPAAQQHFLSGLKAAVEINAVALALTILLGYARLLAKSGEHHKALELMTFVLYHPESEEQLQDEAERRVYELEDVLPSTVIEKAWEKGKSKQFTDVIKEVLTDNNAV